MWFLLGGTARVLCEVAKAQAMACLGNNVTWSIIYGAGMGLILRQCALCGKSHDGLSTSWGCLAHQPGQLLCPAIAGFMPTLWWCTPLHLDTLRSVQPFCDLLSGSGCLGGVCSL